MLSFFFKKSEEKETRSFFSQILLIAVFQGPKYLDGHTPRKAFDIDKALQQEKRTHGVSRSTHPDCLLPPCDLSAHASVRSFQLPSTFPIILSSCLILPSLSPQHLCYPDSPYSTSLISRSAILHFLLLLLLLVLLLYLLRSHLLLIP